MAVGQLGEDLGGARVASRLLVVLPQEVEHDDGLGLLLGAAHQEVLEEGGPDAEQPVELPLFRQPLVDGHVEELVVALQPGGEHRLGVFGGLRKGVGSESEF